MGYEVAIPDEGAPPIAPEIWVFDEGATKGDIVYELSARIPQNEFGLPQFFLRSDLLQGCRLTEDDINCASVGLYYYEGYPTLENGGSFWNQLPHEPQKYYELFVAYLDQAADIGIRQLDLLAVGVKEDVAQLSNIAKEFYWSARARAYDMFIVAAEAKRRQHRIRKMENEHFGKAGALFESLLKRFEGEFADWVEELNAKEAIEVLSELIKIQRMSLGLVGQQSSSTPQLVGPGVSGNESSEAIMRKIAQSNGGAGGASGGIGALLQQLVDNPEEGATIQAAILKITSGDNRKEFSDEF